MVSSSSFKPATGESLAELGLHEETPPRTPPPGYMSSSSWQSSPGSRAGDSDFHDANSETTSKLTPVQLGRAIVSRGMRGARRRNLPFLIVFLTCLFVFFGALTGYGYVEPEPTATDHPYDDTVRDATRGAPVERPSPKPSAEDAEFVVGGPVYDRGDGAAMEFKIAEQRALEQKWAKKKHPNSGAWMERQRDDGARRISSSELDAYDNDDDLLEDAQKYN